MEWLELSLVIEKQDAHNHGIYEVFFIFDKN